MPLIKGGIIGSIGGAGTGGGGNTQLSLSDGIACYTTSFSGVTTTSFNHGLGTQDIVVEFRDQDQNFLVPLNWQAVSANVLDVEFSGPTQGFVTILGCIPSGISPILGGVTLLEGLSGIIDLDSPNGSIIITTSGQVINLNAIFTPGSGGLLEYLSNNFNVLSGLISSSSAGVSTLNGISGTVNLTSPDQSVNINVNGQNIELTTPGSGAPSGASYLLRSYNDNEHLTSARVLSATSGIRLLDQGARSLSGLVLTLDFQNTPQFNQILIWNGSGLQWINQSIDTKTSINGLSGTIQLLAADGTLNITQGVQTITLSGLFNPASGQLLESLVTGSGVRSINGISGLVELVSQNNGLTVTNDGQVIRLTSLFTGTSGALIDQDIANLLILSGIVNSLPVSQTSINGLSGAIQLLAADGTLNITQGIQTITLSGLFNPASGQLLESLVTGSGVRSINGISGIVELVSQNNGLTVTNNGQVIQLTSLFTGASGALIDQDLANLLILSGIVNGLPVSQTSVEGLSGTIDLASPDNSINIVVNGQSIQLTTPMSGFAPSGASFLLRDYDDNNHLPKARILSATSGVRLIDRGARSLSGLVVVLDFDNEPTTGQFLAWNGSKLEWQTVTSSSSGSAGVTTLNGLSGIINLTSPDLSVNIATNGQNIQLTTPGSGAPSGASYLLRQYDDNGHLTKARILSATSGVILDDKGARSVSGLVVKLDFDNEPSGVNDQVLTWNGFKLEWITRIRKATKTFTRASGVSFVLEHGLRTEEWTWSMWRTDSNPIEIMLPQNVYSSGINHAVVKFTSADALPSGFTGKIIFIG